MENKIKKIIVKLLFRIAQFSNLEPLVEVGF